MTPTLRERYAEALIALLGREVQLSDLAPVLERLDALTGLEMHQKALAAPGIEHGSGQAGSDAGVAVPPAASRPLPVVHEGPQEATDSDQAEVAEPPAASPKQSIHRCKDCGGTAVSKLHLMECVTGPKLSEDERYAMRSHGLTWVLAQRVLVDMHVDTQPEAPDVAQVHEPETNGATQPARGLAAVVANPPVEAPPLACTCEAWHREQTPKFSEGVENEGHQATCQLHRKGAHRWPLPSATGDSKGPFVITCLWCPESREVDAQGIPWAMSLHNAAAGEREATHV